MKQCYQGGLNVPICSLDEWAFRPALNNKNSSWCMLTGWCMRSLRKGRRRSAGILQRGRCLSESDVLRGRLPRTSGGQVLLTGSFSPITLDAHHIQNDGMMD